MKTGHWHNLLKIIDGELLPEPSAAFNIDSPWLPGWHGIGAILSGQLVVVFLPGVFNRKHPGIYR